MDIRPPVAGFCTSPSLADFLKKYIWRFIGGALFGALVGVMIAWMLPKQWTATLLIQIGQVGDSDRPLVDPAKIVQRIEFQGFVSEVLRAQKWPKTDEVLRREALIEKSLSAKLTKNSNLVEMTVKGYSPQEAEENLKAAFQLLENEQAELFLPSVNNLKRELDQNMASLKELDGERGVLLDSIEKVKGSPDIDKKFSQSVLLTSLLNTNETERNLLIKQQNSLKEKLSPYRTFATKAIAPLFVPEKPAFPRGDVFGVLGLILGLLAIIVWTVASDAIFRAVLADKFFEADEPLMEIAHRAS